VRETVKAVSTVKEKTGEAMEEAGAAVDAAGVDVRQ